MGWWILGTWFAVFFIVFSASEGEPSDAFFWGSIIIAIATYIVGYYIRHNWRVKTGKIYRQKGPAVEIIDFRFGHWYDTYTNTWANNYPDSAGGWDIKFTLQNTGVKVINYVLAYFYPIDRVGNRCAPTMDVRYTGPLAPTEKCKDVCLRHIWYNQAVGGVIFEKVVVVFEDDSQQTIKYESNGAPYVENDIM